MKRLILVALLVLVCAVSLAEDKFYVRINGTVMVQPETAKGLPKWLDATNAAQKKSVPSLKAATYLLGPRKYENGQQVVSFSVVTSDKITLAEAVSIVATFTEITKEPGVVKLVAIRILLSPHTPLP